MVKKSLVLSLDESGVVVCCFLAESKDVVTGLYYLLVCIKY